jgi:thioredoxin-related protein
MRAVRNRLLNGLVLLGVCGAVAAAAGPKIGLDWQSDIFAAHKVSMRDGKPMLLVFGADWCFFCKKLEQTTLAEPEMVRYINENFVPVHLDVDKDKKVASILEVKSLPCTVVLSPNADLLGRIEGFEKAPSLYRKLAAAKQQQARIAPASAAANP